MEIMKIGGLLLLVGMAVWIIRRVCSPGGESGFQEMVGAIQDENKLMGREARRVGEQLRKRGGRHYGPMENNKIPLCF